MDDEDGFSRQLPEDKPSDNALLTLARDNLALLVPIVGALIFAFRCAVVSGGDPYVAYIVATQTSIGDAIRALLFTVLPILLLILSYVVPFAAAMQILDGNWRNLRTLGMVILSAALPVGLGYLIGATPRESTLTVVVSLFFTTTLLAFSLGYFWRKGPGPKIFGSSRAGVYGSIVLALLIAGGLLVAAFAPKRFWLPRERLDFKNEAPFTGYVLKASQDHLVILNDNPRVIIEKDKEDLEDRDFCYPEWHRARSSNVKSDAPTCP